MLGLANIFRYRKSTLLLIFIGCFLYTLFAYDLVRTNTTKLLILYFALFFATIQIIKTSGFYFKVMVIAAILFRLVFLFTLPNLSQDFYRFIWDGRMILEGFNPYLYTPDSFISNGQLPVNQTQELYQGMGELSAMHFTNYPPLNQLCFVIGNLFPGQSIVSTVIGMRLIIIAADLGTLYFGKKLLEALKLPSNRIFWYILNPFIIIELTGNLHFEGVMIFFLVWSLYLLHSGRWKWAAAILACSISVKLIPLMFLPIFFWWFVKGQQFIKGLRRLIVFYLIIVGIIALLFLPFFSMEFINNYSKTVGLWFNNFEFNASVYYIAREIGYWLTGYNAISIIGKVLPLITLLIILYLSYIKNNDTTEKLITSMLISFSIYLFLSTTVHPWYIATLILLCIFTKYRYPLGWSVIIILSYLAYSNSNNSENLWIISIEYLVVGTLFLSEILFKRPIIKI